MDYSDKGIISDKQASDTCSISVILATKDSANPAYQTPSKVQRLIPNDVSHEIIVVHYNQIEDVLNEPNKNIINSKKNYDGKSNAARHVKNITHAIINGEIGSAFRKGLQISKGQFLLVMDGDYPYPDSLVAKMITELVAFPNSIFIASRYVDNKSVRRFPFFRTTISKGARIIIRHGLKIKDVKDPLSGCFATSRRILENIVIETSGNEILLEILVDSGQGR